MSLKTDESHCNIDRCKVTGCNRMLQKPITCSKLIVPQRGSCYSLSLQYRLEIEEKIIGKKPTKLNIKMKQANRYLLEAVNQSQLFNYVALEHKICFSCQLSPAF